MKKILILIFTLLFSLYAKSSNVVINEMSDESYVSIQEGSYKILEFSKMISKIKVNDSKTLEITFVENKNKPLQTVKVYAKKTGDTSVFIDFTDKTNTQVEFNIVKDLKAIIRLAKIISPELIVEQSNDDIVLKGKIATNKDRDKIYELFTKANVDIEKDLIDLSKIMHPDKMLRVKLYVTEINNDEGLDIKNQWAVGFKDFTTYKDHDPTKPMLRYGELSNAIEQSVTLSGGLSAGANALGRVFNTGLVLNYLSTQGAAKILDETTLITLENKEAKFHAGGTVYIKIQTTTDTGVPTTEIRPIKYGLQLIIKPKDIINGKFVDLEIITKSTQIDWANQVDGIPNFTDKTVETFVMAEDKATVVLGGLITSEDLKNYSKIPFLGDLPLIGALFRSKKFVEGNSELVFFIIPEIVDVENNNQRNNLDSKANEIKKDIKFDKPE